jgi:hypothetical protein
MMTNENSVLNNIEAITALGAMDAIARAMVV